jgi:hypothetical protein
MRLTHIVVSLPLLLCATQLSKPFSMAQAAGMQAGEATTLLAKAQSIDSKCKVLSADKSQELKDFVARAEISLAGKASVAVARSSIAAGRAQGKAAACDATASKLVNDVLIAATAATALPADDAPMAKSAEPQTMQDQAALVEPKEPPVKAKPAKMVKQAALVKAPVKIEKPVKVKKGLGAYAVLAEKYFIARRCRNVGGREIGQMYQAVVATHKDALASNPARDVKAMLRAVETRADGKSCG